MPARTCLALLGAALVALLGARSDRAAASHASVRARHLPKFIVLDQRGRGFAATKLYKVNPQKPWGVAFAYDCGARAGDFGGDVWEVVNAVELPYTAFSAHGKRGHGLHMETGSTSTINAPNGSPAGRVLGLRIKTQCAWHVRVVTGPKKVVARYIPGHA